MEWGARSARERAAEGWILALALLAGTGVWNVALAQVGIQTSMDVDGTGAARIAFFDLYHGDLEIAVRSSVTGVWTTQRVDSRGGKGIHPSLADSLGDPAVAYYDQENGDLVYAKRSFTTGNWQTRIVDAAGDVGSFNALAYGGTSGYPAISYFDATNGDLKYASWNGGSWIIENVDAAGTVGQHCSLAFDPLTKRPVIAYYDATNTALKLARKGTTSWTVESVHSPGVGEYCSLAFDGTRGARISYFDAVNGVLRFASDSSGVWTLEIADPSSRVGRFTSLKISSFRIGRIAYYDSTNGDLKLATKDLTNPRSSWSVETVASAGDVGRFASLAIDPQGKPRVCAYDLSNGSIRFAAPTTPRGWKLEVVDAQSRVGHFSSLAIDAQGTAHVGFFDVIHGRLAYGHRAPSGGWSFETPDASDQAGQYVSLALGAGDEPAMSYYDPTEGELRFASRAAGAWTTEVVDATGAAGMFSSLVLRAGTPHIAYFDAAKEALVYATRSGGVWTRDPVAAGPAAGLYASLALDGAGNPSIAYYDPIRGDLKLATRSGGTWSIETVESEGNVGQYASLAMTSTGIMHIGYHDQTQLAPRYAVKSGAGWSVEAVDAAGTGGRHTSLVLDGSGRPHIAYYNEPQSSLRYAERAGSWTTPPETADNNGSVGRFASLVLDGTGAARAVYYDATNHALKYAVRDPSAVWSTESVDGEFPRLRTWSYPGAFQDQTPYYLGTAFCAGLLPPRADSLRDQPRTVTLRFLRDRRAEARPDFGGYRIYRVTLTPDTARMELIRRYSRQRGDFLGWYFSVVDTTDPTLPFRCEGELAHDSIATFVDPDSSGHYEKFCPEVLRNRCTKDSVFRLVAPAGPHDGIPTFYAVTIEAKNAGTAGTYEDLYVPGTEPDIRNNYQLCASHDPASCPRLNLNRKDLNVTPTGENPSVEPTGGPTPDLETILVVPNPYRAEEVWDQPGAHEVHFIHLPQKATIKVFTVSGDLVVQLEHNDPVRDFEPWNLKNGKGNDVASGIYIYRVESPKCDTCVPPVNVAFSQQSRMVVIR
jgi:subtilisin-like proprotein convertase family protein